MFKFGFSSNIREDTDDERYCACEKKWDESKEVLPENKSTEHILASTNFNTIHVGEIQVKCVSFSRVLEVLGKGESQDQVSVLKAEQNHSDLLPAVYEGGFKIWECTHDLLSYLNDKELNFGNKTVLDLGCGAGIVGIYTVLKGSSCHFQDYNSDVIECVTIPNVVLNSKDGITKCRFYSGDWHSFCNLLENDTNVGNKFDYIFTSETIYNTENYPKLHRVFEKFLNENGVIFLAAKSFYFGVGGGVSLFEDFLDKRKVFKYSCCWKCTDGVKREILKIQFKDLKCTP